MSRPIPILSSVGHGRTTLSAYDDALCKAGAGNCNILRLSSVIPPGWQPLESERLDFVPQWGNRLYVVQAAATADGAQPLWLAAGIGWAIFAHTGGVFVEHEARASSAAAARELLEHQIALSLDDLCQRRDARPVRREQVTRCAAAHGPSCVLVVAVYRQENW